MVVAGKNINTVYITMRNLRKKENKDEDDKKILELYDRLKDTKKKEVKKDTDDASNTWEIRDEETGKITGYKFEIFRRNKPAITGVFTRNEMNSVYRMYTYYGSGLTRQIGQDGKMAALEPAAAFKIATDNQVLVVDQQIFAFNPKKFEAIFSYSYKKQAIADKKVEQILDRYQLNFPEGQDLNTLIAGRAKSINKLQNLELGTKTQEEIVEYSENMALDLMTADDGAIIILDGRDVDTFVSLLNDDYMTSDLTGLRYEIKGKKLLKGDE
jgi:hypothetical protein